MLYEFQTLYIAHLQGNHYYKSVEYVLHLTFNDFWYLTGTKIWIAELLSYPDFKDYLSHLENHHNIWKLLLISYNL
jgi:hypothetical protein